MGMFDYITYNGKQYQTKDTPAQYMADYEIRGNELWYSDVKYEWIEGVCERPSGHTRVDTSVEFTPDLTSKMTFHEHNKLRDGTDYLEWFDGSARFFGHMREISHEWKFVSDFTDKVVFYDYRKLPDGTVYHEEWESVFIDGKMILIRNTHTG